MFLSNFPKKAYRAFDSVVKTYSFVAARALADDQFVALVARPIKDVCYYVFLKQGPKGGVVASLWVAPPDCPDDALERLFIGFRIHLGQDYSDPESFLESAAERTALLVPRLDSLAQATLVELRKPIVKSRYQRTYAATRKAYEALLAYSSTATGSYCSDLFREAQLFANGSLDRDEWKKMLDQTLHRLLNDSNAPAAIRSKVLGSEPESVAEELWRVLYIETLVPEPKPA